jgi:hypothetical protein
MSLARLRQRDRKMSLLESIDFVDTDENWIVNEDETIAAQDAGQLPIEDI